MQNSAPTAPESLLRVGAVIRLRGRLWRVDRVEEHEFAATPLDGPDTTRLRFHRKFEGPLAESAALPPLDPHQLGDPADQDLYLRSLRMEMIHAGAPFLGLQRSRATPETYQLVPLLMALGMERVRLLIGDDVGVGKTIEAGLVLAELVARGLVERALIVVPAALRDQWQDTLKRFFHIDAVVIRGETRPALERSLMPGQSPWRAFPFVITSVDYAKARRGEILAHSWDFVIFDEVHLCARPHVMPGQPEPEMQRWELLRDVAEHPRVRHLLLLSATPHNGHSDSWASLIESLDPNLVAGGRVVRERAQGHIVQRRRKDIAAWYGAKAPFPERDTRPADVIPLGDPEKRMLADLRLLADHLEATGNIGRWVALHLLRRALSCPKALQISLERRLAALDKPKKATKDQEGDAQQVLLDVDGEQSDEERSARLDVLGLGADQERALIEAAIRSAKAVLPRSDGKLKFLLGTIPKRAAAHPKAQRVLVFTRYKDTLEYLADSLKKEIKGKNAALVGFQVFTIDGELSQAARRERYRQFQASPKAVCIATDCISEGLDLQRGCAELVHYELPWNPNRLEQRNGRVDRYGQPEPFVGITTLVREDPLDATILEVIVSRATQIRIDYGFCPVFLTSSGDLKTLIAAYGRRTKQLGLFTQSPDVDPWDRERLDRVRDDSFYGQAHVQLPQVQVALRDTYASVGNPKEVEAFVRSALARIHADIEDRPDGRVRIGLAGTDLADLADESGVLECTFDPKVGRNDPDLLVVDLSQPLVRRLVEAVQLDNAGTPRGRVAARGTAAVPETTLVAQVLARFVAATEPPHLMEELIPVAVRVYGGPVTGTHAAALLHAPPAPIAHTRSDLVNDLAEGLANPALSEAIAAAVEARRAMLVTRQGEVAAAGLAWARGATDIRLASCDPVSVTLLVPGVQ